MPEADSQCAEVDGLTCYFGPFLEVEALGCTCTRNEDAANKIQLPSFSDVDGLREKLTSPESLAASALIPVASCAGSK